jgi:hypothetical protein
MGELTDRVMKRVPDWVVTSKTGPWSRVPDPGEVVRVYRNLNHRCWSIQALVRDEQGRRVGWRVVAHARRVRLTGAMFEVQQSGAQRASRQGRKNVHAYVRGTYQGSGVPFDKAPGWMPVVYRAVDGDDPACFQVPGHRAVEFAEEVACEDFGACFARNPQA